jgi:hypothetical protein
MGVLRQDYSLIRDSIRTGDLFFTASPALFSRLIRFFTRSKISHVGLFVWIGGRLFVAESMEGKGCRLILASVYYKDKRVIHLPTHREDTDRIFEAVLNDVGRLKYDLLGAICSLFVDTKSSQVFCSEWVMKVLQLDFDHLERGVIPADIYTRFYV